MFRKLRQLASSNPFQPFVVALADGRRFPVNSPDMIWMPLGGKGGLHFFVPEEDVTVSVNPLLVVSVECAAEAIPNEDEADRN
jgi:hypothetical protein